MASLLLSSDFYGQYRNNSSEGGSYGYGFDGDKK